MIDLSTFILLIVLVVAACAGIIFFLSSQIKTLKEELKPDEDNNILMEWLKEMKGSVEKNSDVIERQLNEQRKSLEDQLKGQRESMHQQTKLIWERLDKASDVIQGVQTHLGGLQEFSRDMKDLSNVLKSPKLRGGLGEQFLYEILSASLPKDLFKTQFKFRDGSVCDAVITTDKGIIPVDSKFPMENFKLMITCESQEDRDGAKKVFIKDVKRRIDEISSKYILPEEGTTEFAVMYIPSENVFYELIVNTPEIEAYAKQKCVFLTSPNTFSYQVKVLFVAYQQQELEKHAGEILKSLAGIKVEAQKFDEDLSVLDGHIDRATKSMNNVKGRFGRLFGRIDAVGSIGEGEHLQKQLLETPEN
jgi:DNA recombination protein RmuC